MTDVLPHNLEAEENAVGACLLSDRARSDVLEILHPHHLYRHSIARVYQAVINLQDAGDAIDPVLVINQLDNPDDAHTVRQLAASVTATSNAVHHARLVIDQHTRRQLITAGQNISRLGWEPPGTPDEAVDQAEQLVTQLSHDRDPGDLQHISSSLDETFATLELPGGIVTGTPTGLHDVDKLTSGLQPGQLIVIAARPGMGKSALVTTALLHNTIRHQRAAALFSIEMSRQEINQRLLSQVSRIDLMNIRTRNGLTDHDRRTLTTTRRQLEHAPIYTDDTASLRLADIRARARRFHRKHPDAALIAVDYLQLMTTEHGDTRNEEIAHLSRGLKVLARELQLPIVALAQLNRQVEQRHNKRPVLSDLRDSGAIEQDADLVLFLYRDDYYNPTTDRPGITEVLIAKHRNGPTGMVETKWIKERAEFANLAQETPH